MTFEDLENTIKQYLILEDKGIVKLLCAAVVANRMEQLDPTWVFVVSNSSGGKSELLSALSYAKGTVEQDDLTARTFISGAKANQETSLLHRLPLKPILMIKDLTLLLNKDPKESSAIFDQLRLIYDGKLKKSFGTGEDITFTGRVGLIAGTTNAIEDMMMRLAALGERAIKYYMEQPEDRLGLAIHVLSTKPNPDARRIMGEAFSEYLDGGHIEIPEELPSLPKEVVHNLAALADMVTLARSSVNRQQFSRDNPITGGGLPEMPIRMGKQLVNLARALMVLNGGAAVTSLDQRILYKIALDSIPAMRKTVMMAATRHHQITLDGLAVAVRLPESTAVKTLDDLVYLKVMIKSVGMGNKKVYELRSDFRALIAKFESIEMTNEVLDSEPDDKPNYFGSPPPPPPQSMEKQVEGVDIGDVEAINKLFN
jgi:hypothetical protein